MPDCILCNKVMRPRNKKQDIVTEAPSRLLLRTVKGFFCIAFQTCVVFFLKKATNCSEQKICEKNELYCSFERNSV